MTDWKNALQALTGHESQDAVAENNTASNQVERKKRKGVVYSTNPNFAYEDDATEEPATLPNNQQKLRLSVEKKGRAGKTVTLVSGFIGAQDDINQLCKTLKQHCGVGGSVKDSIIIIQGEHKQGLLDFLKKEGYTQTK